MAVEFPPNDSGAEQVPPPPPPPTPPGTPQSSYTPPPAPLTQDEEKTWAVLAHLSVLLNLFTAILGPVASIIIYAIYKDRSHYVAFHALQSTYMQLVLWVGGGILATIVWVITGALSLVLIGLCLVPVAIVLTLAPLAAVVYGIVAAVEVGQGKDFRYYWAADWADTTMKGQG